MKPTVNEQKIYIKRKEILGFDMVTGSPDEIIQNMQEVKKSLEGSARNVGIDLVPYGYEFSDVELEITWESLESDDEYEKRLDIERRTVEEYEKEEKEAQAKREAKQKERKEMYQRQIEDLQKKLEKMQ